MDQRGLVERAQRGDHDAFTVLAGASIARLDAAARLILRDRELARDAVQEAMVRGWRDLPTLRDADRFDAWLHRLLVNACLDIVRRRKRRAIEVELTPIHIPTTADFSRPSSIATSSTAACGHSSPAGARSSCSTTSWGCRCPESQQPRHPAGHRQVAAASRDRCASRHHGRRGGHRQAVDRRKGGRHDLRSTASSGICRRR